MHLAISILQPPQDCFDSKPAAAGTEFERLLK
jgi:hypothetical protein